MFALNSQGHAVCLADYGDIKQGGIVPPVNELWAQVEEWKASNEWAALPVDLAPLKRKKKDEIRAAYKTQSISPVTHAGVDWNGGFESAIKLDAAKRLAETAGAPDVVFYDINNLPHTLSFAEATAVTVAVAGAYQSVLANKQAKMNLIESAETEAGINSVEW